MKEFERDEENDDRSIEEYPGILGYTSDDFPLRVLDPIVEPLNEIDWNRYSMVSEFGNPRKLTVRFDDTELCITLDGEVRLEDVLDQTGLVEVYRDFMVNMTFYPFFLKDAVSEDLVKKGIRALVNVCKDDLAMLEKREADWEEANEGSR